jgi:hypothetical protein
MTSACDIEAIEESRSGRVDVDETMVGTLTVEEIRILE